MPNEPEFNERDVYYLSRVEMYLASKYIDPSQMSRFFAVNSVKRAIAQGIGYEEENRTILSKEGVLSQIAMDMQRNVIFKPKTSKGHKSEFERPGIRNAYQRDLDEMR